MRIRLTANCLLLLASTLYGDTLADALARAGVPTERFSATELTTRITSYAVSEGDPFLIGYYADLGTQELKAPLHLIRYSRTAQDVRRAELKDISTLFQHEVKVDCLGSVLSVKESASTVFVETHLTPSASCCILLTPELAFKTALSGWVVGTIGSRYIVLQESEIHFMSVHPLHMEIVDLSRNEAERLYPFSGDPAPAQFTQSLTPYISQTWCTQVNAQCDPANFDVTLKLPLTVDESKQELSFEAVFDSAGFGDAAQKHVPPRTVSYRYRLIGDKWQPITPARTPGPKASPPR